MAVKHLGICGQLIKPASSNRTFSLFQKIFVLLQTSLIGQNFFPFFAENICTFANQPNCTELFHFSQLKQPTRTEHFPLLHRKQCFA